MMFNRLSVLAVVIAVLAVLGILDLVRRQQLREKYALLWLAVGVAIAALAVARPVIDPVSRFLGIANGASLIFLLVVLFLLALTAHLSWEASRLETRTMLLAEELALLRLRVESIEGQQEGASASG